MRMLGTGSLRRAVALAATASLVAGLMVTPSVLAVGVTQSTTTLGAPSLNPKPVGSTSTVTATVTSGATGDVTFSDNGSDVATVPLDGAFQASYTLPADLAAGNHDIRAHYLGDATYAASEDTRAVTVGPRPVAVTVALSGPRDASGATAQKGDLLTATVSVDDAGTNGSLAVSGGTVQVKVDGAVKATITLPATTAELNTSAWSIGDRAVVAAYEPGAATDHLAGASPAFHVALAANVVEATGASASPATFYPYKDGYKDTTKLRGTRAELASVTIKIYSPAGKLVRTLTAPSAVGAWSVPWNGRNKAGTRVAAGKYKVKQTVRDALGLSRTLPSVYVTVSAKRLHTHTVTLKKSLAKRSAGGPSKGWVGWKFTLPSATVYKKLVFGVYGRSKVLPQSVFGPHDFRACGTSTWNPGACLNPFGYIRLSTGWSNKTGSTSYNRHGRTVKMYAIALNDTTFVSYARVVVTYAVLK